MDINDYEGKSHDTGCDIATTAKRADFMTEINVGLQTKSKLNHGEVVVQDTLSARTIMSLGDITDEAGNVIGNISQDANGLPTVCISGQWKPLGDVINEEITAGGSIIGRDRKEIPLSDIRGIVEAIRAAAKGHLFVKLATG